MTTDKEFSVSHPGFWRTTLPLSESFIRSMNRSLERFAPPMSSLVPAARRGLVNEAGFRVFVASVATATPAIELGSSVVEKAWARGIAHVATMRQFARTAVDMTATAEELAESVALAERTASFFATHGYRVLIAEPTFKGCGWIDESKGDVLADETLFEIKSGDRHFRSIDLQQLLTYSALNFAAKTRSITSVALLNPRVGTFMRLDIDDLCFECAGASAADVLDDVLQYISDPLSAYIR